MLRPIIRFVSVVPGRTLHVHTRDLDHNTHFAQRVARREALRQHKKKLRETKNVLRHMQRNIGPRVSLEPPVHGAVIPWTPPTLQSWVWNFAKRERVGIIELDRRVFGQEIRRDIVHRVVCWQRAKWRTGTAVTKSRSQVEGSTRKMRPQKGSGRARAGSKRPPHWRKGGHAHAKTLKNWTYPIPIRVRLKGIAIALAAKYKEGNLIVIDDASIGTYKTQALRAIFDEWQLNRVLFIHATDELDPDLALAGRNMHVVNFLPAKGANVYSILLHHTVVVTQKAIKELEERLTVQALREKQKIRFVTENPPRILSKVPFSWPPRFAIQVEDQIKLGLNRKIPL